MTEPQGSLTIRICLGDGTHRQKQQAHTARGMIPIEKNIIVVDENGTVFESTWLKRANGLVKKGRARWLNDRTICLACPPEKTEEHIMENMKQTEAVTEKITESAKRAESRPGGLTIENLLDRMDAVRKEMIGMQGLLATMENIANQAGDEDGGHIAEATSDAFMARETTCQQQLRFLEKIYDDHFSAPSEEGKTARMRMILDNMNDVIPSLDYSDENGSGSVEALKVIRELYSDLLKQV